MGGQLENGAWKCHFLAWIVQCIYVGSIDGDWIGMDGVNIQCCIVPSAYIVMNDVVWIFVYRMDGDCWYIDKMIK